MGELSRALWGNLARGATDAGAEDRAGVAGVAERVGEVGTSWVN